MERYISEHKDKRDPLNADWEPSLHIANFDPKLNAIKKQTHKEALFLREENG